MAAITSDENEPQPLISPTPEDREATLANQPQRVGIRPVHKQLAGAAVVLVVFIVCLAVWGAGMEFPTTVSSSEVATTGAGSVTLTKTYRDVSSDAINDAVKWVTREGNWLFGGLKTAVTYALLYIETGLEWLPWPAVVLGLALLSFAVGRWPLTVFTSLALLFAGFMGLWGNMMDTIALMLVAVLLSVGVGFPLGVLAARNRMIDSFMRPVLDGMQTMPSFVYLLPGILFFGLGKPAGIFATIIYAVPPVIRLTNLGIRQVSPETVEGRPFLWRVAAPIAAKSAGAHGPTDHHGRHQPDNYDGAGHGYHRQPGGSRRLGRQRAPGPAEERLGNRRHRRPDHSIPGNHHRPVDPGRRPPPTRSHRLRAY